jgi:predicted glutamine amidotransferase
MEQCWNRNRDGAGFMYALDNKIIIKKELKSFHRIWRKYNEHVKKTGLEEKKIIVFHFRIQTHGNVDEENCHPFYINTGQHMAFCHNGTIRNIKATKDDSKSDTVQFKDKILDHLPKNWMQNPGIMKLVSEYIDYNKLAFLNSNGNVLIFNKSKGEEDEDGIWYSNNSYKIPVVTTCANTAITNRSGSKSYNINDKRNNWHGRNRYNSSKEAKRLYGEGYYGDWPEDDLGDYGLAGDDVPLKGQIWDRFKGKYVWPCDHTDTEKINKDIRSQIDDGIETISELDTIAEIITKMKGTYSVSETVYADLEETKEEEDNETDLVICRRCSAPVMSSAEIQIKTCAWCKKTIEENKENLPIIPGLTKVEESSGESRCHLH